LTAFFPSPTQFALVIASSLRLLSPVTYVCEKDDVFNQAITKPLRNSSIQRRYGLPILEDAWIGSSYWQRADN